MSRFGLREKYRSVACLLAALCGVWSGAAAALPRPESYLPTNTLFFVSVPDWHRFAAQASATPLGQCWKDPALTPFRQQFLAASHSDVVAPLEKSLQLDLSRLHDSFRGQVTLALARGRAAPQPVASQPEVMGAPRTNAPFASDPTDGGIVLLAEMGTNSQQVRSILTELPPKWTAAGKEPRVKKIAGHDFTVLALKDLPPVAEGLVWRLLEFQELEDRADGKGLNHVERQLVLGVLDTTLVMASSSGLVERVAQALTDTNATVLGGTTAFRPARPAFENAALYAWANAEAIFTMWSRASVKPLAGEAAPLDVFRPDRLIEATGFSKATYMAFAGKTTPEGVHYTLRLGAPKTHRRGLVKLLASSHKDASVPPFVFADAVEFDRWRVDARESWTLLHTMFGEISPQWIGSINLILDTANAAAKLKDPKFDIQERLFGNLGDDLIIYDKPPASARAADGNDRPCLYLVSSPNPDQLAASLQSILIFMTEAASAPQQREYSGTTVFSVPLPDMPWLAGAANPERRTLHYAATRGYVALTTDICLLEEFLRAQASPYCSLRDAPGVAEASRNVLGVDPVPGLFGYQNRATQMRLRFELARRDPEAVQRPGAGEGLSGAILAFAAPNVDHRRWFDYRLLPPFDGIAKYFHFAVWSGSADEGGLTWRFFEPTPPALRK